MKIEYLDIKEVGILTDTYNSQIVGIPHSYNVSPEEFIDGSPHQKYSRHGYNEEIHSEKLIVCKEKDKIIGFADVAIANTELDGKKEQKGFIRFLTYKPGCRSAGQLLLDESEKYLKGFSIQEIKAFRILYINDHCGYRFYHLSYGLLSDKLGHIFGLFGMNGYKINGGEICMDQPNYNVNEPILTNKSIDIKVEQKAGRGKLPNLEVYAYLNGNQIGECVSCSIGEFINAREAQDWIFIVALFINDSEQAKGLGRYLLQRNLWESLKLGYKHTSISTDWRNYRALLFYTNYGYYLVDTSYEFIKTIA
jgi:GNAT superfamily N-acetyltransferase